MQVSLISPEKTLFEGEAESISLPGSFSPFTVFAGHAPIISSLSAGKVTIVSQGEKQHYVIDSGFVEVRDNKVSALVESALSPQEIDVEAEEKKLAAIVAEVVAGDEAINKQLLLAETTRQKIRAVKGM